MFGSKVVAFNSAYVGEHYDINNKLISLTGSWGIAMFS